MDRILVVVFDSESKAHEAARALHGLEEESVIAVHAEGIVTKDADGRTNGSDHERDPGHAGASPSAVSSDFRGPAGAA